MATSLTFGNHLKFGQDSCHTSKGRPTFLPRETEYPKLRANHTIIERGLQQASHAWGVATASGWTKAWRFSSCSWLDIDRLMTPLGINKSLAFRAFNKTIIFGLWLSKTQKLALAFVAFFWKRLLLYPSRLFSEEQKNIFPKNPFPKGRLWDIFTRLLPLSSYALSLSFTCKHRVAKFNFRYTFIRFHSYIYIYIYAVLWKSFSPSLRIAWHIHPFWAESGLRTTGVVTSL